MERDERPGLQVWTGRHVSLELILENGEREVLELDLVPDSAADFDHGFLGESTPLARAILGKLAGSEVPYRVGDIVQVRIVSISPHLHSEPKDLSERREDTLRKAVEDSDRTSTVIYATSMSNKWGDMDPIHLDKEGEESSEEAGDEEGDGKG